MSKSVVNIVPSFLLRGINPNKVLDDYVKGFFSNIHFENVQDVTVKTAPLTIVSVNSNSPEDPVFVIREKNSFNRVFVFANQEEFKMYQNNVEKDMDVKISRVCDYCLRKFDHQHMVIPLIREIRYIRKGGDPSGDPIGDSRGPGGSKNGNTVVKFPVIIGDGKYCDYRCTFAALKCYNSVNFRYRDLLYNNSEMLLRELFEEKYPNQVLTPAPNRSLLKSFGGSLDYDEWSDHNFTYDRMINPLILPAKIPHEKCNVN